MAPLSENLKNLNNDFGCLESSIWRLLGPGLAMLAHLGDKMVYVGSSRCDLRAPNGSAKKKRSTKIVSASQMEAKRPLRDGGVGACRQRLCARGDPPGELLEELAFGNLDIGKIWHEVFTRPYPQAGAPDIKSATRVKPPPCQTLSSQYCNRN